MIPPVASLVLEDNPLFSELRRDLAKSLLGAESATKVVGEENHSQELLDSTAVLAKEKILKYLLSRHLRNYGDIGAAQIFSFALDLQLDSHKTDLIRDLPASEVNDVVTLLPKLIPDIAEDLDLQVDDLEQMLSPVELKSWRTASINISNVPSSVHYRLRALQTLETESIPSGRQKLTDAVTEIVSIREDLIALELQHIELHVHGSELRNVKARAEQIKAVSEALRAKVELQAKESECLGGDIEAKEALHNYYDHLLEMKESLVLEQADVQCVLRQYEDQGSQMKALALEYGNILEETEHVRDQMQKL